MQIEDRERLVRVEEGVKSIDRSIRELSHVVQTHVRDDERMHLDVTRKLSMVEAKAGFMGIMGGVLLGFAKHFLEAK